VTGEAGFECTLIVDRAEAKEEEPGDRGLMDDASDNGVEEYCPRKDDSTAAAGEIGDDMPRRIEEAPLPPISGEPPPDAVAYAAADDAAAPANTGDRACGGPSTSARADADETSPDDVVGREELTPDKDRSGRAPASESSLQSSMRVSRRDCGRDSDPYS